MAHVEISVESLKKYTFRIELSNYYDVKDGGYLGMIDNTLFIYKDKDNVSVFRNIYTDKDLFKACPKFEDYNIMIRGDKDFPTDIMDHPLGWVISDIDAIDDPLNFEELSRVKFIEKHW